MVVLPTVADLAGGARHWDRVGSTRASVSTSLAVQRHTYPPPPAGGVDRRPKATFGVKVHRYPRAGKW